MSEKPAILFDIDGTLANPERRRVLLEGQVLDMKCIHSIIYFRFG
jgi:hydroxymethylpyrimidine pyrophosphatase-like HAD family hydrolase